MSIHRSSLICVAYLQVYERVADNRWWPNIGGLLYTNTQLSLSKALYSWDQIRGGGTEYARSVRIR